MCRPKLLGEMPSASTRAAKRARNAGSGTMTLPRCAPAMLKVLVAAVIMTNRSATPSIKAKGVWRWPG